MEGRGSYDLEDALDDDADRDLIDLVRAIDEVEGWSSRHVGASWTRSLPDAEWEAYRQVVSGEATEIREQSAALRIRRLMCVTQTLKEHGVRVHHTVLARMLDAEWPDLFPTVRSLLIVMLRNPDRFKNFGGGVFGIGSTSMAVPAHTRS